MGRKPARVYKKPPKHPYTRVSHKTKSKDFVKGAPGSKITIFKVGHKNKRYDKEVQLRVDKEACLRSGALESMRVAANNRISKDLDLTQYYLYVPVYPHHILRHNPQAGIAQADRFYQGMSKPFGRPIGRGAIVDENQVVLFARVMDEDVALAREALNRAGNKLGTGFTIRVTEAPEPEVVKEVTEEELKRRQEQLKEEAEEAEEEEVEEEEAEAAEEAPEVEEGEAEAPEAEVEEEAAEAEDEEAA